MSLTMISVILVARDDEERLLRSLAALVPHAAEGIVADVIVADLGSRDGTREVADAAGCTILADCRDVGTAIGRAAEVARKDWLLRLVPGDIATMAAMTVMRGHVAQADRASAGTAIAFLAQPMSAPRLHSAVTALAFDMLGRASPQERRVLVR